MFLLETLLCFSYRNEELCIPDWDIILFSSPKPLYIILHLTQFSFLIQYDECRDVFTPPPLLLHPT